MADARRKLEPNRRELLGGVVVLTILAGVIVTRQGMPQSSLATPVALHPLAEHGGQATQLPINHPSHPRSDTASRVVVDSSNAAAAKKPQATRDQARSSQ